MCSVGEVVEMVVGKMCSVKLFFFFLINLSYESNSIKGSCVPVCRHSSVEIYSLNVYNFFIICV